MKGLDFWLYHSFYHLWKWPKSWRSVGPCRYICIMLDFRSGWCLPSCTFQMEGFRWSSAGCAYRVSSKRRGSFALDRTVSLRCGHVHFLEEAWHHHWSPVNEEAEVRRPGVWTYWQDPRSWESKCDHCWTQGLCVRCHKDHSSELWSSSWVCYLLVQILSWKMMIYSLNRIGSTWSWWSLVVLRNFFSQGIKYQQGPRKAIVSHFWRSYRHLLF